jgi:hypothetical protein
VFREHGTHPLDFEDTSMSVGVITNADRFLFIAVLVTVKTAWYLQPPSPHQVLYTLPHVTIFLKTEGKKRNAIPVTGRGGS